MKAIILLIAIFAISNTSVNHLDVSKGLSNKLGLTPEQQKGFQACAIEARDAAIPYLAGGKAATQARLIELFFGDNTQHREFIIAVIKKLQTDLPKCYQFALSVAPIFTKATLSADEQSRQLFANHLVQFRFIKYSDRIYSALFNIYKANNKRDGTAVGENIAEIIQLFAGLSHPQSSIENEERNMTRENNTTEVSIVKADRFIQQTLNTAAKELGSNRTVTKEEIKTLRIAIFNLTQTLLDAQSEYHHTESAIVKEINALGDARDLIKSALVVRENVETILKSFFPDFPGFAAKLGSSEKRYYNMIATFGARNILRSFYKNSPTVAKREIDLFLMSHFNHYVATGKALAALVKTLA